MGEEQKVGYEELLAASRAAFEEQPDFTLAVEEEFALLDPGTLELVNRFEDVQQNSRPGNNDFGAPRADAGYLLPRGDIERGDIAIELAHLGRGRPAAIGFVSPRARDPVDGADDGRRGG